ncbi:MAG: tetratricopeptide repeat protein [Janthinobacterium lividum]
MNKNIEKLSLSAAYFSLTLSIQTLFPTTLIASDKNIACPENEENYFERKYSFSPRVLNTDKLKLALVLSKEEEKKLGLFSILKDESKNGNTKAQEALYKFYRYPCGKLDLSNLEEAKKLLQFGLEKKQAWAYWTQAEESKSSTTEITKNHFLAANLGYPDAVTYLKKNYKNNCALTLSKLMIVPTKQQKKSKGFIPGKISEIEAFRDKYIEQSYALPLIRLYQTLSTVPHLSSYKTLYWSIVKAAADLDDINSIKDYGNEQYRLTNFLSAFKYFQKAGDLGSSVYIYNVGFLLAQGFEEQDCDKKQALKYYEKAANLGHSDAMYSAGLLLMDGFEGRNPEDKQESNKKRALKFFKEAVKLGHSNAAYNVGALLYQGFEGQGSDKKQALEYYEKAANLGHRDAMYLVGTLLMQDFEGQSSDKKRALKLFEKAASLGHVAAICNVGTLLYQGFEGQNSDKKQALEWLKKGVNLGDPIAMHNLAVLLMQDFEGQNLNESPAIQYLQQAANENYSSSMVYLATLYLEFYESNKVNSEYLNSALFWLEKAQVLKNEKAAHYLNVAQGYLDETILDTEEDDRQLEQLLQETKDFLPTEIPYLFLENIINSKENKEKLSTSEAEKTTSSALPKSKVKVKLKQDQKEEQNEPNISESKETLTIDQEKEISITEDELSYKKGNIKQVRANLRQMALLRKEREAIQAQSSSSLELSSRAKEIALAIKENSTDLNDNDLRTLFKDRAFQDQIEMTQTKSGILISAHNRMSNQHMSASTHRKHTDFYKGMQPAFIKELKRILEVFPNVFPESK